MNIYKPSNFKMKMFSGTLCNPNVLDLKILLCIVTLFSSLLVSFYLISTGKYQRIIVYGQQNFRFEFQGQDMFELGDFEESYEFVRSEQVQSIPEATAQCCSIASGYELETLCSSRFSIDSSCNCTDYMMCKLRLVTALSGKNFNNSWDFFGSSYTFLPDTRIIVYDLGLSEDQVAAIKSQRNVQEVRKFEFDRYPEHVKDINTFSWRPLTINEVGQEHELIFYCDINFQIQDTPIDILPNIFNFPLLPVYRLKQNLSSLIDASDPGMLNYLQLNARINKDLPSIQSLSAQMIIWMTDQLQKEILSHWVDCAMHVECISPTTEKGRRALEKRCTDSCHGYDESALNLILLREFKTIMNKADIFPAANMVLPEVP